MPKRIQFRRGVKLPPGAVYVGRPSIWGNPFKVSNGDCSHPDCGPGSHPPTTRADAVDAFKRWLTPEFRASVVKELRGKDLACWCPVDGLPCNGDVLLEIANA